MIELQPGASLRHLWRMTKVVVMGGLATACRAPATAPVQPGASSELTKSPAGQQIPHSGQVASSRREQVEAAMIVVTKQDNGRIVRISTGQAVVVELFGKPTTGYDWSVDRVTDGLGRPTEEYVTTSNTEGAGALKRMTWKTSGVSPGRYEIQLSYTRKPGDSRAALEQFTVTLQVSSP